MVCRVWFQCSALGFSSMHQLLWQAVDGSTAAPNGFHISRLSSVFWPTDRKLLRSLPFGILGVCGLVCMKPCRLLSWSQVQSRQPGRCLAVEIWCVEITAAEKLFMLTFWHYLSDLTQMPAMFICPLVPLTSSLAKFDKKYMGVLVVDRICCLDG